MRTAVVILNWNTRGYLERWLPSLVASCPQDAEVVVADSASTDGSLDYVREAFPGLRTIALDANYGFTGGYNRAIGEILSEDQTPEYIVLINSDVQVASGWLEPLLSWMDAHPECGVCGPVIHSLEDSGRFEYAGAAGGLIDRFGYPFCRGRVPGRTELDRGQYGQPRNVLWVSGACLMTRSSLWKDQGGLDARFFAHMEEIDYCWRAALSGYVTTVVPESSVLHLGGGTLPKSSPFKLKLNFRNNLLLLEKNLPGTIGPRKAKRRIFARMVLDFFSAAAYFLTFRPSCAKAVWDAHMEYRRLSGQVPGRPEAQEKVPECHEVAGYCDICVILHTFLRGKGVFKYIEKYENSH